MSARLKRLLDEYERFSAELHGDFGFGFGCSCPRVRLDGREYDECEPGVILQRRIVAEWVRLYGIFTTAAVAAKPSVAKHMHITAGPFGVAHTEKNRRGYRVYRRYNDPDPPLFRHMPEADAMRFIATGEVAA